MYYCKVYDVFHQGIAFWGDLNMRKSGFTLMEIVVALCLLTIIVVGFLPVFISANALNTNFERNYDAQVVMGIYMKERVQNSV